MLCSECLVYVVAAVSALTALLYFYFAHAYTYWSKRGVPSLPAVFPFGNVRDVLLLRTTISEIYRDIYQRLDGHSYGGFFQFHVPVLLLRDPEVIKTFLAKDFASFHDRGIYFDEKNDPLAGHLFFMPGQKWRNLRAKLTPTFTSGKMKMMFQSMLDCGQELQLYLGDSAEQEEIVEIKDLCARYTTDIIASCAFGIQCNSLKDPEAEFRVKGRDFFLPGMKFTVGLLLNVMAPSLASKVSWGQTPQDISDFFRRAVRETVEYREKNGVSRNDFMQLMIQLKNQGYVDVDKNKSNYEEITHEHNSNVLKKLNLDQVSAQAFVFFLAGFETSSSTISFCLYELALNTDIQTRLRQELDEVLEKHGGHVTYDAIQEMDYLDRVVSETLRKYPPLAMLNRECTSAYTLDSGVRLEPGTQVVVPVLGLHHDPQYFPEPQRFDPERFTADARAARPHYAYLPFGEGPRICIGMRFGILQTKIGLVSLLMRYEVRVCGKTKIPLTYDPRTITMSPEGGIFLQVVNRSK